ncbi:MAG: hypothetical protein COT14_03035 [Candidatus Diapherotrites archaeon CG08_land_8_20_14_0_20_30_16]|nr:MAG: hypothetical protein COT14_03035 [Candidatus Diapherotrites archaeon CG08_land_8_20_14_0_20_30_16]
MVETFSLQTLSKDEKIQLLYELGFKSDGIYVLDPEGKKIKDKYIDVDVKLENMLILPSSTIILDNNPMSIASYLEEHPDVF